MSEQADIRSYIRQETESSINYVKSKLASRQVDLTLLT